jgi:hypothetical protein
VQGIAAAGSAAAAAADNDDDDEVTSARIHRIRMHLLRLDSQTQTLTPNHSLDSPLLIPTPAEGKRVGNSKRHTSQKEAHAGTVLTCAYVDAHGAVQAYVF